MARKILIDTDPGIDDALALALALAEPALDVLAVTATGGNVSPELATRNVQILLEQLDPPRLPRLGASIPGQILRADGREIHGPDGLGGANYSFSDRHHRHRADKLICDTVRNHPGEVTILALGPLTNIAAAIQREPELSSMIGHLVITGGAITEPGNITPVAEFNMFCDAEAAQTVFRSHVTKTLIPLDVTRRVRFGYDFLDTLPPSSTQMGALLRKILPSAFRAFYQRLGIEGVHLHDVVALASVLHPEFFETERLFADVETEGELTHGATIFDRRYVKDTQPNIDVAVKVDRAEVLGWVQERFAAVKQ